MSKVPVQKTVMRNGKPHIQTYWEDSEPQSKRGSALSGLAVPLPGQNTPPKLSKKDDPVHTAWSGGDFEGVEQHYEACVAAGLTPGAALTLKAQLPEGVSLSDHVYDTGMDQMSRPRNGWQYSDSTRGDQRSSWLHSGVPLEKAVEWIDAGFDHPWSGIPKLIEMGVSADRANEWEQERNIMLSPNSGSRLYMYKEELRSDITVSEANAWAKEVGSSYSALDERALKLYGHGFKASEAKRWLNISSYALDAEHIIALRDLKWSPSAIKATLKELTGYGGRNNLLDNEYADEMIRVTPLVGGPKVFREWTAPVYRSWEEGYENPQAVQSVVAAEQWKGHAEKETGVDIPMEVNMDIARMLLGQRDTYIQLMQDGLERTTSPGMRVDRAISLTKVIPSLENYRVLKEHGFPIADDSVQLSYVPEFRANNSGYRTFQAETADQQSLNRWLRNVAADLYWKNTAQNPVYDNDRERFINDDSIDPIQFKDLLLKQDGDINPVQAEGILKSGIKNSVSDGWL